MTGDIKFPLSVVYVITCGYYVCIHKTSNSVLWHKNRACNSLLRYGFTSANACHLAKGQAKKKKNA